MVCALRRRGKGESRFSDRMPPVGTPHLSPQVRLRGEVHRVVAPRDQKYQSNFVEVCLPTAPRYRFLPAHEFRNYKIVYRRYAGLFFCVCVDANDNELAYLEAIHLFVEVLGVTLSTARRHYTFLIPNQIHSLTTFVNSTWFSTFTRCDHTTISPRSNRSSILGVCDPR